MKVYVKYMSIIGKVYNMLDYQPIISWIFEHINRNQIIKKLPNNEAIGDTLGYILADNP